jgi:ribosomal protein S24E
LFANIVKKTKGMFGMDTEDYKSKFYYSEARAKELEEKLMFLCRQMHAVMDQVDTCTKGMVKNESK